MKQTAFKAKLKPAKARKCANRCGNKAKFMTGLTPVCSTDCSVEYGLKKASRDKEKQRRKENREYDAKTKELKRKYGRVQDIIHDLVKLRNKQVRLRDWDKPCISCNQPIAKILHNYHAGHIYHAGTKYKNSWLRLDPRNIHGQCCNCNSFKSGCQVEAMEGIKARYGEDYLAGLIEYKRQLDSKEIPEITYEDCLKLEVELKKEIKELEKSS